MLNKRPTATLAWLWAILLFPVFGTILYLMIGTERVQKHRRKSSHGFRGIERWARARFKAAENALMVAKEELPSDALPLFEGLTAITQLSVTTVTGLKILRKSVAFYGALQEDIRRAQCDVLIESYIWRNDEIGAEFLQLLVETAQRGVKVRLLLDDIGSLPLRESYFAPLIAAGGEFSWCHTLSPLRNRYSFNLRNHRKLQVIDGTIAYVGGMNFGREYAGLNPAYGDWADLQIRVEGPVVQMLQQIFAEDWFFATEKDDIRICPPCPVIEGKEKIFAQVLRSGPDEEDHPMLRINMALVAAAQTRLWIGAGYFVPGETMQTALQVVAARGVDVRILISKKSEHPRLVKAGRSYYDALLRQGVRLFEYDKGIEHSKYIIVDDEWSTVGSSNFDERSMRLNFELSLLTIDRKTNEGLSAIFLQTTAEAKEIDRETFARRPLLEKLEESALRPLSPVL